MAEIINTATASEIFNMICSSLDKLKIKYEKNDVDLSVKCVIFGRDIPIDTKLYVDIENKLIVFQSNLKTVFPPEKIVNAAVAINAVNFNVIDGAFGLDVLNGTVDFKLSCSFEERQVTNDLVAYIILCSFNTVDAVNDKLEQLLKEEIELEEFIKNFGY